MENNKKKNNSKNKAQGKTPLLFFLIVSIGYLILYFVDYSLFLKSFNKFLQLSKQIVPFLFIVFIIMFLNLLFIKPAVIKKHLGEQSGLMGYVYAIIAGIISVGSVYMWYPLLKDLRNSGMSNKLIAVFVYNRSIKLHLLPLMIFYFGLKFTIALTIISILFSLVIAVLVQRFVPPQNKLKEHDRINSND